MFQGMHCQVCGSLPGQGLASALRSHTLGLKLTSHRAVQQLGLLGWHSCCRTGFGGRSLQGTTRKTLDQEIMQLQCCQAASPRFVSNVTFILL